MCSKLTIKTSVFLVSLLLALNNEMFTRSDLQFSEIQGKFFASIVSLFHWFTFSHINECEANERNLKMRLSLLHFIDGFTLNKSLTLLEFMSFTEYFYYITRAFKIAKQRKLRDEGDLQRK